MVSMEQLIERRDREAKKLEGLQAIRKIKDEKREIKEDIRKLQGKSMRTKYGVTREQVIGVRSAFGKAFKGSMPVLKRSGIALGKGLLAMGHASNEYYGAPMRKAPRKKVSRKKTKKKKK